MTKNNLHRHQRLHPRHPQTPTQTPEPRNRDQTRRPTDTPEGRRRGTRNHHPRTHLRDRKHPRIQDQPPPRRHHPPDHSRPQRANHPHTHRRPRQSRSHPLPTHEAGLQRHPSLPHHEGTRDRGDIQLRHRLRPDPRCHQENPVTQDHETQRLSAYERL